MTKTRTCLSLWCGLMTTFACGGENGGGSPPSGVGATENLSLPAAPRRLAADDETARIEAYVAERYSESDVRHRFETQFGETIDCIDFDAHPTVRSRRARGLSVPAALRAPQKIDKSKLPSFAFRGEPDSHGQPRECPEGTVPMLHLSVADIQATGGLDAFTHLGHRRPPRLAPSGGSGVPNANGSAQYGHVQAASIANTQTRYAQSSFSMFTPPVPIPKAGDPHIDAQVWVLDDNLNFPQTVEAGWIVEPNRYSKNPQSPHLFIYATRSGYQESIPCWNGSPGYAQGCVDWVPATQAVVTPGMTLAAGQVNGQQLSLQVSVANVDGVGWQISASSLIAQGALGAYVASDYAGQMQTSAANFWLGGEVYDPTTTYTVPMGSGADPNAGYGQSAVAYNYFNCTNSTGGSCNTGLFWLNSDTPSSFAWSKTPGPGSSDWSNYFYFGDVPASFWGGDFGANFFGEWKSGSYKGTCGMSSAAGHPVTGVSSFPSGLHQANAVRCDVNSVSVTKSACYNRDIAGTDNRGTTVSGEWDINNVKDECAAGEYVQGVAQTTSGVVDSILCCPAAVTHSNCKPQVFYGQNSPAYASSSPDWDYGHYKGQCPAGQYVGGISVVHDSKQGPVGAPHAILCCSP